MRSVLPGRSSLPPGARCSGYTSAVIFYRAVNFSAAPVYATVAILLSLAAIVGMYFWMKTFAKKEDDNTPKVILIHSAH